MEKNTFGSFLAALRKANGMTQKDLAEKLNVSDKAVSRWERDENYPDLTLLPVLADIFNVTTDELLRGSKNPVTESNVENSQSQNEKKKSEKQVKNQLRRQTNKWIKNLVIFSCVFLACALFFQLCVEKNVFTYTTLGNFIYVCCLMLVFASLFALIACPIVGCIKFNSYVYEFEECSDEIKRIQKKLFVTTWIVESILLFLIEQFFCFALAGFYEFAIIIFITVEIIALLILQIIKKNKRAIRTLLIEVVIIAAASGIMFIPVNKSTITALSSSVKFDNFSDFVSYAENNPNPHVPSWEYVDIKINSRYYMLMYGEINANENDDSYFIGRYMLYTLVNVNDLSEIGSFRLNNEDIELIDFQEKDGKPLIAVYTSDALSTGHRIAAIIKITVLLLLLAAAIATPLAVFRKRMH